MSVCTSVCPSCIWFLLDNLSSPGTNHFKFGHKLKGPYKEGHVEFRYFHSRTMHLFTSAVNRGIHILWTHSINKRNNHLLPQIIEHWKDHDIGCWKLRGPTLYLGTGTKCIIQFSVLIIYNLIFQWQIYHNMNPS